jgi:tetratricopeptide (TPR) repeat protein
LPLQAQGEFALVKEKLESALELSGQPVKRGTMAHKHIVYMMLADAAAQLRDAAALQRYSSLLEELAARDGHQPYLAVAHRAWGIAHRLDGAYDEAEARLGQALALFEELEAGWQIGRTLVEIGELALAQSDQARANEYFSRALTAFESLEARPDAERVRVALGALA